MVYFDMSATMFVDAVIDRLDQSPAPLLYIHVAEDVSPDAVVMTWEHYDKILALVPEGEAITELVMQHDHVFGGADS